LGIPEKLKKMKIWDFKRDPKSCEKVARKLKKMKIWDFERESKSCWNCKEVKKDV